MSRTFSSVTEGETELPVYTIDMDTVQSVRETVYLMEGEKLNSENILKKVIELFKINAIEIDRLYSPALLKILSIVFISICCLYLVASKRGMGLFFDIFMSTCFIVLLPLIARLILS